ncbi:MAG: zf-HC2 domain-containing protein [Bauldia sp.]
MLSCREVTAFANDYVDHQLSGWRLMQVRMHLLGCRHCRAFVRQLKTVTRLVRKAGAADGGPTKALAPDLLQAFRQATSRAGSEASPEGSPVRDRPDGRRYGDP